MRVYGNLVNRFLEHSLSPKPEVGMGATIHMWSDRYPATVVAVSDSGKTVTLREDKVTDWEPHPSGYGKAFADDPSGRTFRARIRKNGTWRTMGAGEGVTLGSRAAYRDPHF